MGNVQLPSSLLGTICPKLLPAQKLKQKLCYCSQIDVVNMDFIWCPTDNLRGVNWGFPRWRLQKKLVLCVWMCACGCVFKNKACCVYSSVRQTLGSETYIRMGGGCSNEWADSIYRCLSNRGWHEPCNVGVSAWQQGVGVLITCGTNGSMRPWLLEWGAYINCILYHPPPSVSLPPELSLSGWFVLRLFPRLVDKACWRAPAPLFWLTKHTPTSPPPSYAPGLWSWLPCGSGTLSITCLV